MSSCIAVTRLGRQCSKRPNTLNRFCRQHQRMYDDDNDIAIIYNSSYILGNLRMIFALSDEHYTDLEVSTKVDKLKELNVDPRLSDKTCIICMELVSTRSQIVTECCNHIFCRVCLIKSVKLKNCCPHCRKENFV
jgi:hypothetical protein